jgi:hypothetical protein
MTSLPSSASSLYSSWNAGYRHQHSSKSVHVASAASSPFHWTSSSRRSLAILARSTASGSAQTRLLWWLTLEWLEQPDVEYIMELGARRQLQPIRHVPNPLQDEERPIEFWTQLSATLDIERGKRLVDQAEPNPLADGERDLPMLMVIEVLVLLLRLFEPLPYLLQKLIALLHLSLHCWNACLTR